MMRIRFSPATRRSSPYRIRALVICLVVSLVASGIAPAAPSLAVLAAPAPPLPLLPPHGVATGVTNYPPLGIPQLTWSAVGSTTRYRLQFSQDAGFSSPLEYTTANASYIPADSSKFPDGVWFWRVRVDAPVASEYSEARSFVKEWANFSNRVQLDTPADASTLDFYDDAAFSWQPVIGAASYRFQIATAVDGFSSPTYNQVTAAYSHQPTGKLANGTYYWRVVPLDPNNREGKASEVRAFTVDYHEVPTLLEPANNATPTFTPTFRWAAVRGAQFYRLQYSTDPTFNTSVTSVDTRNTTHTPVASLPNDVNYYWRVRVHSGASIAGWSETRTFRKQWYVQPELLTPTNNFQYVSTPTFSWTPIAGASAYKFEINCANSFPPGQCGWTETTANPMWSLNVKGNKWLYQGTWFWRVTPIDASNGQGRPSLSAAFYYTPTALAPQLIYPTYYFPPNQDLQPHEDHAVGLPVFSWHRVMFGDAPVRAYRIEVDDDPLFMSVNWRADTENPIAAPTAANPFTPTQGVDYYWRVQSLDLIGGWGVGPWSQRWRMRVDMTRGPLATIGAAPTLVGPVMGAETAEIAPLLEWLPLEGADSYEVEISTAPDFAPGYGVTAETTRYPVYAPRARLAYGTYYWRVRGRVQGAPLGEWSAGRRFHVAASSHWLNIRTLGSDDNRWRIGEDTTGVMTDANFDVTDLYAAQAKDHWFFGFFAPSSSTQTAYVLYLDLDRVESQDTAGDPRGYRVATIPAHRPEYAIYVFRPENTFSADQVAIYRRSGDTWAAPQTLSEVGGGLFFTSTMQYLELQVPSTAVGMDESSGSASISLFSAFASGGHAQDAVPSDPAVRFPVPDTSESTTTLSRFTGVTERLTPAWSPGTAGAASALPTAPPLDWHLPTGVYGSSWYGYQAQVAVDPSFTSVVKDYLVRYSSPALAPASYTGDDDYLGDNTYYWRVRTAYDPPLNSRNHRGAWSQPSRFERAGFVPQSLRTSVTFATPTFSWDKVEGAQAYDLQVDDDPNFGSPAISTSTHNVSYTSNDTLANGTYYWRVRVKRYGNITNDWTSAQTFTLSLPRVTGLHQLPAGTVDRAPTLCWTPLIAAAEDTAVLAAYKYRVQVSRDPTFSSSYDQVDTEQACWTPTKTYDDGSYHWRVAMIDGSIGSRLGSYGEVAQFDKQYGVTTLISPSDGSEVFGTPVFVWTPVTGAGSYKFEVAINTTFSPVYDSITTNNVRFMPTKRYDPGKTYYWRVAMQDKDRHPGPFEGAQVSLSLYPYRQYLPLVLGAP